MSDTSNGSIERTLQLAGNTTFTVSLPKEWAVDRGLQPGDLVHLYPHRDRLLVAPDSLEREERTATIDAGAGSDVACRLVRAAYASGCDRIEVTGRNGLDRSLRLDLTRSVDRLLGMEIEAETDERIVLRDLLDPAEVSLPQSTAQIRRRALGMHEDAIEAFVAGDRTLANRVLDRSADVDRLAAFVSRGVHRGLEDVHEIARFDTDRTTALRSYRTARRFERIADGAGRIATAATRLDETPDAGVASELEAIASDTRTVVERSLAGDLEQALAIHARTLTSVDALERSLSDRTGSDAYLYGAVLENVREAVAVAGSIPDTRTERR